MLRTPPIVLALVLSLPVLAAALAGPQNPDVVAVHQCVPLPPGLPLGPETCANAYAAPGAPAVGTEVYNRALVDSAPGSRTTMATLGDRLYTVTVTGQVRSTDGATWRAEPSVPVGPVNPCGPVAVLGTFNGKLYAGTSAQTGPGLWRLDPAGWVKVHTFSGPGIGCHIYGLREFGGRLHLSTSFSKLYAYDGAAMSMVLDIGLGTQGATTLMAVEGGRMYAAAYPQGIYTSGGAGWTRLAGTAWYATGLAASGGKVYATSGDTLYTVGATGATPAAQFPARTLGPLGDVAGKPAFGAANATTAELWRWDDVAATTFMEAWPQGAFGALGNATYLSRGGDVARIDMLVDLRPVPAP